MRMKSRTLFPPGGGFSVLHPEAGQKQAFVGSFNECVQFETNFRRKNPALCQKYQWSLNQEAIEAYVDESNAQRCVAHGWQNFVSDAPAPEWRPPPDEKKTLLHRFSKSVVEGAETVAAGVGVWLEVFGAEGKTVTQDKAEHRASVCVNCPLNDTKTSLKSIFVESAVRQLHQVFGILNNLDLHTSQDAKLGVCTACTCALKSKTWVDISHITAHMSEDVKARLDPGCWVLAESKA